MWCEIKGDTYCALSEALKSNPMSGDASRELDVLWPSPPTAINGRDGLSLSISGSITNGSTDVMYGSGDSGLEIRSPNMRYSWLRMLELKLVVVVVLVEVDMGESRTRSKAPSNTGANPLSLWRDMGSGFSGSWSAWGSLLMYFARFRTTSRHSWATFRLIQFWHGREWEHWRCFEWQKTHARGVGLRSRFSWAVRRLVMMVIAMRWVLV